MDLASPWCNTGEETKWLFFLVSLRCLQNIQKMGRFTAKYFEPNEQVCSGFQSRETKYFISSVKWEEFCQV